MIPNTIHLGLVSKMPCKRWLFCPLIVHSWPPFPFTFCFLPPVNFSGTVWAVFRPVGLRYKSLPADHAASGVPVLKNFCFQCSELGQDCISEPLTADRAGNALGTDVGVPIILFQTIPIVIAATLTAKKSLCLFVLCRGHAIQRTISLAFYGWQVFVDWIAHLLPPFVVYSVFKLRPIDRK